MNNDAELEPLQKKRALPSISTGLPNSIKECENDDEPVFHFEAFPSVLTHILTFLDVSSLKNCREVSQIWNDEASRVLSRRTKVSLPALRHPCIQKNKPNNYDGIKNSSRPFLFTNIQATYSLMRKAAFKDLVQNCGINIKGLEVTSEQVNPTLMNEDMGGIYKVLTEHCPNLNTLEVTLPHSLGEDPALGKNLEFSKALRITTLKFEGFFTPEVSNFYIKLIKFCPELTHLDLNCVCPSKYKSESESVFCRFLQNLSELPDVTENLKEFCWGVVKDFNMYHVPTRYGCSGGTGPSESHVPIDMKVLKFVSKMKFSQKLKKLTIGSSADDLEMGRRFLPKLLKNVGQFVEHLTFTGTYQLKKRNGGPVGDTHSDYTPDFPEMPNVKFLSNQSLFNYGDTICPKFVAQVFPNLVKYVIENVSFAWLRGSNKWSTTGGPDSLTQTLKKDEDFCTNESLKSLVMFRRMTTRDSFNNCIKFYPNLTSLVIVGSFEIIGCPRQAKTRQKVPYVFSQIVKFKNLRHFTYMYSHPQTICGFEQLCEGLKKIKKCEQLESLNIVNTEAGTQTSFASIKNGLDELAGLKCTLRISRFHMPENEVVEMMSYAKENEIRLEWVDANEEENGRDYHLPPDSVYSNHKGSIVRIGWDFGLPLFN